MARQKQTRGACQFCKKEMTKGGLTRHLKSCSAREEALASAKAKAENDETIYHLKVEDAYSSDFWLHLEMRGSAKLSDLDNYLRAIWLECCGHLSMFSFGGWSGGEIAKSRSIQQVLGNGETLTHIYDFGTSSETKITAMDRRTGAPLTKKPIFLMARNNMPDAICMECDKQANWLCMECLYEDDVNGLLCDEHADTHPHDNYGEPVELYNSPRVGMCGYDGPAEAPY